jgi:hypothetical protein
MAETTMTPIHVEKLTSWSVLRGGTEVCLDFVVAEGGTQRMMALRGLLPSARKERFSVHRAAVGKMAVGTTGNR